LRLALLQNKSHALNAGGGVLPLIEYLGLPQENVFKTPRPEHKVPSSPRASDAALPVENGTPVQCGGNAAPCP
ncbi:MAG: hypothetical protein FWG59_01485, partial [Betaproteobacteria bacterium]|nr:hypothetical protein [Betaproteobacteria bacterium]